MFFYKASRLSRISFISNKFYHFSNTYKMEGLSKTTKEYFFNTYLFESKANIQKIIAPEENKDEFRIIVDKTIFHP
jgi:hypothetical protein